MGAVAIKSEKPLTYEGMRIHLQQIHKEFYPLKTNEDIRNSVHECVVISGTLGGRENVCDICLRFLEHIDCKITFK